MNKKIKIIAIVLTGLTALCCVGIGVGSIIKNDKTTTLPENSTAASTSIVNTTAPTTTASPEEKLKKDILGRWRDSADMSGYEFFSDGTVEITYVNLTVPVINLPVNGTTRGTYSIEGDTLTTKCSIYSATIENKFRVSVDGNELSMYNLKELETATYLRSTEKETTEPEITEAPVEPDKTGELYDDEILGSWINSDSSRKLSFSSDGSVEIRNKALDYSGIYMTDGDSLIIQYVSGSEKVTETYAYSISKNTLSLDDGSLELFIREGTGSVTYDEDELLGVWRDSADMSGYEFKPGGIVSITYVNLTIPVVNIPINGTYTGSYSVDGDKITIKCNVNGNSINDVFTFFINENSLIMEKDGVEACYIKQ